MGVPFTKTFISFRCKSSINWVEFEINNILSYYFSLVSHDMDFRCVFKCGNMISPYTVSFLRSVSFVTS